LSLPALWPIYRLVIFDCDSTLATIEGIDELARLSGANPDMAVTIASLTKRAMEGDIPLEAVYHRRLEAVKPTRAQVQQISRLYAEKAIPDAAELIQALQAGGAQVFIVSGGLIEPVCDFGTSLGVPADHIFAVEIEYDQLSGRWWRYWDHPGGQNPGASHMAVQTNPLTRAGGKGRIIHQIRSRFPGRAMLIGDGLSDLEAGNEVDLFIGFGGAVFRPLIASEAPIYIHSPALASILPLALGQAGTRPRDALLWADGLRRIMNSEVSFKDAEMKRSLIETLKRSI
jgi:phosphoserine phosphatase